MMQVGQNLVHSKEQRLPLVARPILLDRMAIDKLMRENALAVFTKLPR